MVKRIPAGCLICGLMALTAIPRAVMAQEPATKPADSVDLSTPNAAMKSLVEALAAGDHDRAYRCIAVDPHRAPTELDALMTWNIAQNQLMAAGIEAFGKDAVLFRSPAATFDGLAQAIRTAHGEPAKATLNAAGDEATFTVEAPKEIMDAATPKQAENIEGWIGHQIRCKKIGNDWKFDMDHSIRVDMDITDAPDATPEETHARNASVLIALAKVKSDIANDIRAGHFASAAEVPPAIKNGDRLVIRAVHGRGLTIHVLPFDKKESP